MLCYRYSALAVKGRTGQICTLSGTYVSDFPACEEIALSSGERFPSSFFVATTWRLVRGV